MIKKNFDIDFKNLLINKNHFQKRKKSKDAKFNKNKKYFRIILIIVYITVHIIYVSICKSNASSNIENINQMSTMGRSLMRSYTRIVHISTVAALTGKISVTESLEARDSLQYLVDHRGVTIFGEKADKLV